MKAFLIFTKDNGNREDCSVYYSHLVFAETEEKAIDHIAALPNSPERDVLEAQEMPIHVALSDWSHITIQHEDSTLAFPKDTTLRAGRQP